MQSAELANLVVEAAERTRPHVRETPVSHSPSLSAATGADVWLKCENFQVTGSFKIRGAVNSLATLPAEVTANGVVAASSGNHGIAVAYAGRELGVAVTVFVPEGASPVKVAAMRRLGAEVSFFGTDGLDTELEARRQAAAGSRRYVSPYNDIAVIAGQGTVGLEVLRQLGRIDAIVVSVGGGGLIGGIASYFGRHSSRTRVIGAQPANSCVMARSVRAGHVVDIPSLSTLSDGTAGGLEADTITFALCRDLVDDWVLVDEGAIGGAMRQAIEDEHMLIEGSAGVAVAALHASAASLRGQRVAVVLCGANVSAETLRRTL